MEAGTVPGKRFGPLVSFGLRLGQYQDRGLDLWFNLVGGWYYTRIKVCHIVSSIWLEAGTIPG